MEESAAEVHEMEKKNSKLERTLNIIVKKNLEIRSEKDENEATKERMKMELQMLSREFEKQKKSVEEDKKDID